MYLSELLQKPILSLYEGEILGNITNVYFDKTRKKIKSFEIMNDEEINYHLYPKFIYTIGKHAITIKNNQHLVLSLNMENESASILPINAKVYSLQGEYLGVVKDDVASSCEEFKTYTKEALGVDSTKYFNSGILVMNLLKFRQDKMLDKFINLLKQIKFYVAPDQDYLNILCLDNVLYLSEDWNKAPLKGVVLDDNVKLVHFKLTAKPWHYENIQASDLFWKYAKRTKFYDILHNTLINYSLEEIEKDNLVEINLIKFAVEETKRIKKIRNEKQLY